MHRDLDRVGPIEPGQRRLDGGADLTGGRGLGSIDGEDNLDCGAFDLEVADRAGLHKTGRSAGGGDVIQCLEDLLLGERHGETSGCAAVEQTTVGEFTSFPNLARGRIRAFG